MTIPRFLALAALPVTLAACTPQTDEAPLVDMANPASVHCGSVGGETVIKDGPEGQTGYCRLPDGQLVDEWALYRDAQTG